MTTRRRPPRVCENCRLHTESPLMPSELVVCTVTFRSRARKSRCTLGMHEYVDEQMTIEERSDK